jgi:hypothetical protein
MDTKKSCFNCKNAIKSAGFAGTRLDPPEPPEADCQCTDVPEYLLELSEPAEKCGWYDPELIKKCDECGKEMNAPEYLWEIWAYGWDRIPCCSHLCKAKAQGKIDIEFQYQLRDYRQIFPEKQQEVSNE